MTCNQYANDNAFNCYGVLTITQSSTTSTETYSLTCTSTEDGDIQTQNNGMSMGCNKELQFNVTTCAKDSNCQFKPSNGSCMLTWGNNIAPSCQQELVKTSCETKCKAQCSWISDRKEVICSNPIQCKALLRPNAKIMCRSLPTVTSSSTTDAITTSVNEGKKNAISGSDSLGTGTTVITLGVVTGLTLLALLVVIIFTLLWFRRRRKRSTPGTNDYTDMNIRDVGKDSYESPRGITSKQNVVSNTRTRESAMYMDIDDVEIEKANQGTQQDHGAMDNVYNSIDDCGDDKGYAQPDDLLTKMSSESKSLDHMHGQANYFVLEKQDENHEDQANAESYFVLEKSENESIGNVQTENESGNAKRTDNYFILEEQENMQQNAENVSGDNYFLLEKDSECNLDEDRTIDGTYNTLNTEIDIRGTDDYSHARTVCSSEENEPREGSDDREDYDKLFQKPNTDVVRDSDNDYDHMNDDDH